jgi:hypothetical protein
MEIDHSASERVKQLEAEILVYRDALHRASERLLDTDSWLARIADAIQIVRSALRGERHV